MTREVSLSETYTEKTEMLVPNDTNAFGRAMGGVVLHWMDVCAAISAMRFAGQPCVTASMDNVNFLSGIDVGEVVTITAYVFDTGETSIDVKVEVHAGDPTEESRRKTTASFFTFVAIDDQDNPVPVPDLVCDTEAEAVQRDTALSERRERAQQVAEDSSD